jgi:hypothetical protein
VSSPPLLAEPIMYSTVIGWAWTAEIPEFAFPEASSGLKAGRASHDHDSSLFAISYALMQTKVTLSSFKYSIVFRH